MRLDKVEIVGFKSFCDRQEVDFKGGVTGIVGPNGCGKSNISDAISWVLGEQSAKSLRGASMEDVIFNGSQARQPVGMAEVNLQVSGLNGNSPDGNPEATVTRRLYRNGESEYLMNGHVCRLRDIQELFMDTGLGSKAYSIIEQGKIGQILSSKPTDRRLLIEEAAGITKYKARRRQTQLKLEATQQNLLRVNDIVLEVEKQLESLKRQAAKARRWRAQKDEMQALERVLFGRRFLELQELLRSLTEQLETETERERTAAAVVEAQESELASRRAVSYEAEARLEAVRARLAELNMAVNRHGSRSGYCREQIGETEARLTESRQEATDLEARIGPLGELLQERSAAEATLREQLQAAEAESRAADAAVQEASGRLAGAERELDAVREAQVALLGKIAALQNAGTAASGTAERAAATLLRLQGEAAEVERERTRVAAALEDAEGKRAVAEELLGTLREGREDAQERIATARIQAQALHGRIETLQSERDGLSGRLASLEEMIATHRAFDEGVRALLARPADLQVLGVVADSVETESAHERAVESFLGDALQAVLVPDAAEALRGVRFLEEGGAGRGSFLPLATAPAEADAAGLRLIAASEPSCRGLLSDLYKVTGPHAEAIRASLPEALVVDTLEDALALWSRHGRVPCATLQGELLDRGFVEGGRRVKGLLAPRREVREIHGRLEVLEADLTSVREAEREQIELGQRATEESRLLEGRIHESEKDLVALRRDLAQANDEAARLARKSQVLQTEHAQADQERQAALARIAQIEQSLATAEAERVAGSEKLVALGGAVAEARVVLDQGKARSSEARSAVAALRERVSAAQAECRRLEAEHRDLVSRLASARTRAEELARRGEELARELEQEERLLAEASGSRDEVTGQVAVAEEEVKDLRLELEGREASLREGRQQREALREALAEIEVAKARTDSDLGHVARECQMATSVAAAEAGASLTDDEKLRDVPALEVEIAERRERLEKMGQVNVLAVEQAQEHEERHTFLTAQRQDLLDSIAELSDAVKKIDKASRERFAEAFQAINQHFGEIFKQLFGGGTAGLSLLDEEDVLESGIDVMAQPPGKRLQSVLLLSGGEKAMTAIALLFAIFQYKPSPFCILDEVDAPLDDANIGRFVRMLEGLKAETQFVLITHSRKTMEIADQLYGVTMEEPGVSKLVSVRLS